MARVAIVPVPQTGHLNATFGLAQALRARGHEVVYFSIDDLADAVAAQGFAFRPILRGAYAPGYIAAHENEQFRRGRLAQLWATRTEAIALFRATAAAELGSAFVSAGVDVVLTDREMPGAALCAVRERLPTATLSTTMPARRARDYPPLSSGLVPSGSWRSRARVAWSWNRIFARRWLLRGLGTLARRPSWRDLYGRLARECGLAETAIRYDAIACADLALPQLVLCPRVFDFAPGHPEVHYGAAFVNERRREAAMPLAVLSRQPLVLCSLGSQGHRLRRQARFLRSVLEAFRQRPRLRLIMVVGRHLDRELLGAVPANAEIHAAVPQLEVLRRSAAMITHGGLNSVKECIHFGVPMLVFPTGFDQPGNAARVAHHGVGLRGDVARADADAVGDMLDAVLDDRAFRRRTEAMSAHFRAADRARAGLELIEGLAAATTRS